jgi:hypothetical protein
MPFDKSDARAEAYRAHGADEAGRAAAQHDEVVSGCRLRIPPRRRMHQIDELAIRVV